MSNLYEKQALDNYLNDGITHGKKISYGSLGRIRKETHPQHVNSDRRFIVTTSKPTVNKNENNSKSNVIELLHKIKMHNAIKKNSMLQTLTMKETDIWNNLGITISDIDIYLAENNDFSTVPS